MSLALVEKDIMPEVSDVQTEGALLGLLLTNNKAYYALPVDLMPDHFSEPVHRRIFTSIRDMIDRGSIADPFSLKTKFDADPALSDIGGGGYLSKIAVLGVTLRSPVECAKNLIDLACRRKIILECTHAIQQASDMSKTSGEIAASLLSEIENEGSNRYRISTEREVSERLVERIKTGRGMDKSSTGFERLDNAMGGGLYAGKLYGVVGRKKMGKTMLAGTISTYLQKASQNHLYIALEMGSDEIGQRNMARELNLYESAFRTGFANTPHFLNKMADYAINAKNHRLYLDAPGITFNELKHILPMHIRKHKIKGFILDYWQLVGGKTKGQSDASHYDEVAQWMAEITKRYNVWGIVIAQENQDGSTRGSEGIRLACDQLYRICKTEETSEEAWLEMMETRYTKWNDVGNKSSPSLHMSEKGTHYDAVL